MKFVAVLLLIPIQVLAHSSYKFIDQTLDRWSSKGDPQLSISEMNIGLGGSRYLEDRFGFTEANWKIETKAGTSCPRYSIVFRVEDRSGKLITEETKAYVYPKNGGSDEKYNQTASNILFSGRDHSAKFSKRFEDKMYLTVKYWLKDLHCEKALIRERNADPDRVAFTLESVLRDSEKKRGEEREASNALIITFERPSEPAEKFIVENFEAYYLVPRDLNSEIRPASTWKEALRNYCDIRGTCSEEQAVAASERDLLSDEIKWECKKAPCVLMYAKGLSYPNPDAHPAMGDTTNPCNQLSVKVNLNLCTPGGWLSEEKCTPVGIKCKRVLPLSLGGQIQPSSETLLVFYPDRGSTGTGELKYEFGGFRSTYNLPSGK